MDFYKENEQKFVQEFIKSLNIKQKAAVVADLNLLEEFGNLAREPLSKHLEDGIFELRTVAESIIIRILYFLIKTKLSSRQMVLLKRAKKRHVPRLI